MYNKEQTELICYPAGKTDTSFTIPGSVTSIGDNAFSYCTGLKTVFIKGNKNPYGNIFPADAEIVLISRPSSSVKDFNINNNDKIDGSVSVILGGDFDNNINVLKIGDNVKYINDNAFTTTEPITIYGYEVSAAQSFCERAKASGKNNITFEKLTVVKGCVTGYIPDPSKPDEVPQATMSDALALFKAIVYDETDRLFCWQAADMNGDGDINLADCLALLMALKNQATAAEAAQSAETKQSITA